MQEILDNAQIFNGVDSSSQCDETNLKKSRPTWRTDSTDPLKVKPRSDLTVTHVNQTYELERVKALAAVRSDMQTTEEWLRNHCLQYQQLTLKNLLTEGRQVKRPGQCKHMVFDASIINEFEYKLNTAIENYHRRIKWLMEGTRKTYGMIKGDRVGVLIDSSDANTGFGRLKEFQRSILDLIDEQLQKKKNLYFLTFGTDVKSLWNVARDVNGRIVEEARDFVRQIRPSGGCNLLAAFKKIMKVKRLNSIVIILGSCPDQTSGPLFDYVQQCMLAKELPIQAIAYDTSNNQTHSTLQKLMECSKGRYHCYSSSDIKESYRSSDVQTLLRESQRALDLISKIKQMRSGMLGEALISIDNEISLEVESISPSRFLPRPPNHHKPLNIEHPNFHPSTSAEWLVQNGLQAKRLNLYQVLAPNAFNPVQDFIPILGKSVASKVNEMAMQQFEWHDGTIKNMHVDVAMLYDYQKKLGTVVKRFEKRIHWLASGSRRIWGTICEKRVILLVDTSLGSKPYMVYIQHSLRMVLEQQLANKDAFNIIAFGSVPKMWKPQMVEPTVENLQAAWKWVLRLEANGSRNLISAFRTAVENDDDTQLHGGPQGLYCITSGIADQNQDVACTFINEKCTGNNLKFHSILFCIDDYQETDIPCRYANMKQTVDYIKNLARSGNGRFHWFRESGIIESDDVTEVMQEMEKAVRFSQRCTMLVDLVKTERDSTPIVNNSLAIEASIALKSVMPPPSDPRQTASSLARIQHAVYGTTRKSLAWRPTSKKAELPDAPAKFTKPPSPQKMKTKKLKAQLQPFYTEKGNNVGSVYGSFPKKASVRKSVPEPILPEMEEKLSTKYWLKRYGLNRLKLNINRLVSDPVCVHEKSKIKSTGRTVHAKWFEPIFPSIEVNDKVMHIDMNTDEIGEYEIQVSRVLKRYFERLHWLLSGSRQMFGVILEKRVVILLDISGSMDYHLDKVKNQLISLIWDQLYDQDIAFNIVAFSDHIASWQEGITEANEDSCNDAIRWLSSLSALGSTKTLGALQEAFKDSTAEAIYLVSDGKPDTSVKFTLEEAKRYNNKNIPIHAVSLNGNDSDHTIFMKTTASNSGGRFHVCDGQRDAHLAMYNIVNNQFADEDDPNLPDFQGDDLRLLSAEITKGRKYLTKAKLIRKIVQMHKPEVQNVSHGAKHEKPFLP